MGNGNGAIHKHSATIKQVNKKQRVALEKSRPIEVSLIRQMSNLISAGIWLHKSMYIYIYTQVYVEISKSKLQMWEN